MKIEIECTPEEMRALLHPAPSDAQSRSHDLTVRLSAPVAAEAVKQARQDLQSLSGKGIKTP